MPNLILDLSHDPCRLGVEGALLVLRRPDQPDFSHRMDEIAAICVSQPAATISFRALGALASNGVVVVVCDERHAPTGMLMPLSTHHAQTPRFAEQAAMTLPDRKRLWQQIVQSKVTQQAQVLKAANGTGLALMAMVPRVMSGDTTNIEATAAAAYWRALMGDDFRRDYEGKGINALLNYGYAIVRSAMCRAICASGLHPTLGLHHHHRENPFCLADDLMEPFRPLVDCVVWQIMNTDPNAELTPENKRHIIDFITERHCVANEERTLFDLCARTAQSLVRAILGTDKRLDLPVWDLNAKPN